MFQELKTSKDWYELAKERKKLFIYSPDGWPKENYDYSFNQELISQTEFNKRVLKSNCIYLTDRNSKVLTCNAMHLDILCQNNTSIDINNGGTPILGYDFYIEINQDMEKVKQDIKLFLRKYKRPFISFKETIEKNCSINKIWTISQIEECIKENEPC